MENDLIRWLWGLGMLLGSTALGYLFRKVLSRVLIQWFGKTETKLDDIIFGGVRRHIPLWFLLVGALGAGRVTPFPERLTGFLDKGLLAVFVISASFAAASVLSRFLEIYAEKFHISLPATSLTENLLRLAVVGMGALLLLSNLGVSIAPVLTALGVGSLAVALALQDTLSNLFAGFYILLTREIRVGDYVKLDSGQEGYVADIRWRTTAIRELPGNLIFVPNAKLAQAIVTNYYFPEQQLAVLLQAGVSYGSDLARVEHVTMEVAKEVMREVPGGVPEFDPFIRYHTFGDSSINFTVILRGKEVVDQHLLKHEFVKRLHARYKREGIEIPFPQRVVHLPGGDGPSGGLVRTESSRRG